MVLMAKGASNQGLPRGIPPFFIKEPNVTLESSISFRLMRAPDDAAAFGTDFQSELREFKQQAEASGIQLTPRFGVFDSPSASGGLTGEFVVSVAQFVLPVVTTLATLWISRKNGRKLRVKVGDKEIEAQTKEEIDFLIAKAKDLAVVVDPDHERADQGRNG